MRKNALLIITAIVAAIFFASCSKQCSCTATLNGQVIDQIVYEDMTGRECEAQTDVVLQDAINTYDPQSLVGLEVSCSHL